MTHVCSPVSGRISRKSRLACRVRRHRRLQLEALESRQLLAAIVAELGGPDAETGMVTEHSASLPCVVTAVPSTTGLPPGEAREIVFRDMARPDWQWDGELGELELAVLGDRLALDPVDASATAVSGPLLNAGHVTR